MPPGMDPRAMQMDPNQQGAPQQQGNPQQQAPPSGH